MKIRTANKIMRNTKLVYRKSTWQKAVKICFDIEFFRTADSPICTMRKILESHASHIEHVVSKWPFVFNDWEAIADQACVSEDCEMEAAMRVAVKIKANFDGESFRWRDVLTIS